MIHNVVMHIVVIRNVVIHIVVMQISVIHNVATENIQQTKHQYISSRSSMCRKKPQEQFITIRQFFQKLSFKVLLAVD